MFFSIVEGLPIPLQMTTFLLCLIIGVYCLIKFCNMFLDSASLIAKKLKIPPLIIGLTIVAMGTSFPELAGCVSDAVSALINGGNANIGFSNVVGSNISNLLLVLAFSCLFTPIIIKKETKRDYIVLVGVSTLLTIFGVFFGINSFINNKAILRWEAIILVCLILFYVSYIVINAKKHIKEDKRDETPINIRLFKTIIFLIIGLSGIVIGGELVVYGAKGIAFNISSLLSVDKNVAETFIGLTIVAVGTSLPELVSTIIASKKKENEMALGNIIGSNIFNVIFVLGISGAVSPFTITSYMIVDLFVMIFVTLFVFVFVIKGKLTKKHSFILLVLYVIYLTYLILRTIL